jgi:hypothetical protein
MDGLGRFRRHVTDTNNKHAPSHVDDLEMSFTEYDYMNFQDNDQNFIDFL